MSEQREIRAAVIRALLDKDAVTGRIGPAYWAGLADAVLAALEPHMVSRAAVEALAAEWDASMTAKTYVATSADTCAAELREAIGGGS